MQLSKNHLTLFTFNVIEGSKELKECYNNPFTKDLIQSTINVCYESHTKEISVLNKEKENLKEKSEELTQKNKELEAKIKKLEENETKDESKKKWIDWLQTMPVFLGDHETSLLIKKKKRKTEEPTEIYDEDLCVDPKVLEQVEKWEKENPKEIQAPEESIVLQKEEEKQQSVPEQNGKDETKKKTEKEVEIEKPEQQTIVDLDEINLDEMLKEESISEDDEEEEDEEEGIINTQEEIPEHNFSEEITEDQKIFLTDSKIDTYKTYAIDPTNTFPFKVQKTAEKNRKFSKASGFSVQLSYKAYCQMQIQIETKNNTPNKVLYYIEKMRKDKTSNDEKHHLYGKFTVLHTICEKYLNVLKSQGKQK